MTEQLEQMTLNYSKEEMELKYLTTLQHIEKIIEYTEALGINEILFEKANSFITILSQRLSVNPVQAVLFAQLFSKYNVSSMGNEDLSALLKCTPIKLLYYMNDLEELEKKKFIVSKTNGDDISYRVPMDVVNTFRKEDTFVPEIHKNITIDEFFGILEELFAPFNNFDSFDSDKLSSKMLGEELISLIDNNMHLLFCQKIMSYKFSDENIILLLCFCHLFVNNCDDNICFHDFRFIFDRKSKGRMVQRRFREGDHILMECKFIENTNSDGFVDKESFKLTDQAKKDLFVELDQKSMKINRKKNLVLWETLEHKKMFYNEKESHKIGQLISLLKDENFKTVQERFSKSGMRKGFACLFSGSPGTGKTETVYQIARETERNLMAVDISCIKGMYVGETEKQIKAVFDNYRNAVNASDKAPILLFNEADAIIGKRMEFKNNSRSVDRMENTMQNIILQEMESLNGILIATTNLTQNMDKAFERRFLYKITFEKPDLKVRKAIWQTMLPGVPEMDISELASRFDFSGGQIENIARKRAVENVLSGNEPSLEALMNYCKEELTEKQDIRIGFTAMNLQGE